MIAYLFLLLPIQHLRTASTLMSGINMLSKYGVSENEFFKIHVFKTNFKNAIILD